MLKKRKCPNRYYLISLMRGDVFGFLSNSFEIIWDSKVLEGIYNKEGDTGSEFYDLTCGAFYFSEINHL